MARGTKKGTVAILGWYFHRNFGDTLVLKGLQNLFHDWTIIPMNDRTIDFDVVNKCDLFVLGGGELINTDSLFFNTPSFCGVRVPLFVHRVMNRAKVFNNISWVHRIKVPKVVLGCGVNAENIDEINPLVIKELEQFDYIGLRDQTSIDILKSISSLKDKVNLFFDAAFSSLYHNVPSSFGSEKFAVVIPTDRFVRGDRGVKHMGMSLRSKAWLKKKLEPFDKAMFVPFGKEDNDDYVTCLRLQDCCRNSEVISPNDVTLTSVVDLISRSGMVFSYRLHGLILAFMLGKHYDYYPYHWKLDRVFDTIKCQSVNNIRFKQRMEFKNVLLGLG